MQGALFGAHLLDKSTEAGCADLVAQGVGIVGLAERAQLHGKADAAGGRCCRRGRGRCRLARGGLRLRLGLRGFGLRRRLRRLGLGRRSGRCSRRTRRQAFTAHRVAAGRRRGGGGWGTGARRSRCRGGCHRGAAVRCGIQGDHFGLHIGTDLHRLQAGGLGLCTVGVRPHAHTPCLTAVDGGRFCEARQLRALQVGNHGIGVGLAAVGAEGDGVVAGSNRRGGVHGRRRGWRGGVLQRLGLPGLQAGGTTGRSHQR